MTMDVKYWNRFAHEYDDLVTDALTYGRTGTIKEYIAKFASPTAEVADFGCGPGKLLPILAKQFGKVYGYDFSDRLLAIAEERCKRLDNVVIAHADLSQPVDQLPPVDLAVSLNAAIMPDTDLRMQFLKGMASRLKPGGHLMLDVPSVESLLFSAFRETEWYRRQGDSAADAELKTDLSAFSQPKRSAQGLFVRGGELTKHYLREELIVLTRDVMKLGLVDIVKMEYDWKTELEETSVPRWMRDPYPWDWLVIAQREPKD